MAKITIDWLSRYLEIGGVYPNHSSYDISFDAIIGHLDLWLIHLKEKNWWTDDLEHQLVTSYRIISEENGSK